MHSKFATGFEKTAVLGAIVAGARAAIPKMIGAVKSGIRGAASGSLNAFTRAASGNLRKPITGMDRAAAGLTGLGAVSEFSDNTKKWRDASMR